jgi:hypothetical protein
MKKEYKELVDKYLEANPQTEVKSIAGGWGGKKTYVNGRQLHLNHRGYDFLSYGRIEEGLLANLINDAVAKSGRYYTSYKVSYKNNKFEGDVKHSVYDNLTIDVPVEIPEDVWFDSLQIRVDVKSKKTVKCELQFIIKNGINPPSIKTHRPILENEIVWRVKQMIKDMNGRISGSLGWGFSVKYNKNITIPVKLQKITHTKNKLTIEI